MKWYGGAKFVIRFTHKNAALVLPKFGLTVEKRPGAAIEGGSTRIRLLADSELTQVNKIALATINSEGGEEGADHHPRR